MRKISAPGNINNRFVDRNLVTGQPGTRLDAPWLNAVQDEICNAIKNHGNMEPDPNDSSQLSKSLDYVKNNTSQVIFYGDNPPSDPGRKEWHNTTTNERFTKFGDVWVQQTLKISTNHSADEPVINIIASNQTLQVNRLVNIITRTGEFKLPKADLFAAGSVIHVRIPRKHKDISAKFITTETDILIDFDSDKTEFLWNEGIADFYFTSNGTNGWVIY